MLRMVLIRPSACISRPHALAPPVPLAEGSACLIPSARALTRATAASSFPSPARPLHMSPPLRPPPPSRSRAPPTRPLPPLLLFARSTSSWSPHPLFPLGPTPSCFSSSPFSSLPTFVSTKIDRGVGVGAVDDGDEGAENADGGDAAKKSISETHVVLDHPGLPFHSRQVQPSSFFLPRGIRLPHFHNLDHLDHPASRRPGDLPSYTDNLAVIRQEVFVWTDSVVVMVVVGSLASGP